MDNKQKRIMLSLIYKTMLIISIICMLVSIFLCAKKLYQNDAFSVMWLDITLISLACILIILSLCDIITTKKLDGKFTLAKCYYMVILLTFIATICLGIYVWMSEINFVDYLSYILPIGLILGVEIFQIICFIIGMKLTGLNRKTSIVIDSSSPAPNIDDEIELKKKLDNLNRKLEIKKLQDQIDDVEKKLDE